MKYNLNLEVRSLLTRVSQVENTLALNDQMANDPLFSKSPESGKKQDFRPIVPFTFGGRDVTNGSVVAEEPIMRLRKGNVYPVGGETYTLDDSSLPTGVTASGNYWKIQFGGANGTGESDNYFWAEINAITKQWRLAFTTTEDLSGEDYYQAPHILMVPLTYVSFVGGKITPGKVIHYHRGDIKFYEKPRDSFDIESPTPGSGNFLSGTVRLRGNVFVHDDSSSETTSIDDSTVSLSNGSNYIYAKVDLSSTTPVGTIEVRSSADRVDSGTDRYVLLWTVTYSSASGYITAMVQNYDGDIHIWEGSTSGQAARWKLEPYSSDEDFIQVGDGRWERNGKVLSWSENVVTHYVDGSGNKTSYPSSATCYVVAVLENSSPTTSQYDPSINPNGTQQIQMYVVDSNSFLWPLVAGATTANFYHNGAVVIGSFTTDSGGDLESDSIVQYRSSDIEDQQEQLDSTSWVKGTEETTLRDWYEYQGLTASDMNVRQTLEYYDRNPSSPHYGVQQIGNADTVGDNSVLFPAIYTGGFEKFDGSSWAPGSDGEAYGLMAWLNIDSQFITGGSKTNMNRKTLNITTDATSSGTNPNSPQPNQKVLGLHNVEGCVEDQGCYGAYFDSDGDVTGGGALGELKWAMYDSTYVNRSPERLYTIDVDRNETLISLWGALNATLGQVPYMDTDYLGAGDHGLVWDHMNTIDGQAGDGGTPETLSGVLNNSSSASSGSSTVTADRYLIFGGSDYVVTEGRANFDTNVPDVTIDFHAFCDDWADDGGGVYHNQLDPRPILPDKYVSEWAANDEHDLRYWFNTVNGGVDSKSFHTTGECHADDFKLQDDPSYNYWNDTDFSVLADNTVTGTITLNSRSNWSAITYGPMELVSDSGEVGSRHLTLDSGSASNIIGTGAGISLTTSLSNLDLTGYVDANLVATTGDVVLTSTAGDILLEAGAGSIIVNTDILADTSFYDIGDMTNSFSAGYISDVYVADIRALNPSGYINVRAHLYSPDHDDLGTSGDYWNDIYIGGSIYVDGDQGETGKGFNGGVMTDLTAFNTAIAAQVDDILGGYGLI